MSEPVTLKPMTEWSAVKLTEARQVAALIGTDEDDLPAASIGVQERYLELRRGHALFAAVEFLCHALPRREAVGLACSVLGDESQRIELPPRSRIALEKAMRWIADPADANRRAAFDAAQAIARPVPERFLGLAVFYSGGSVSGEGAPLPPPLHACSRFAASAIEQAAYRAEDSTQVFESALDLGERIAVRGMSALTHLIPATA